MHRLLTAFGLAIVLCAPAKAQEAAGAWHGALTVPGGELRLVVKLRPVNGGYEGEMVSLDQGAQATPLSEVKVEGGALAFTVPAVRGRFEGRWDAARAAWAGQWVQGSSLPLILEKGDLPPGPVIKGLDGAWQGALSLPTGARVRLVLHVRTGAYGTAAGLDSPDQLAYGLPVSGVARAGDQISFSLPRIGASFTGRLDPDGRSMVGAWTQGGGALPLTLQKTESAAGAERPQTPKPPFPYAAEEVTFDSAPGVRLAGTLTLPQGKGPHPAVVLITGSGPQDRDETLLGHKPFLVLADHLSRRGVAVLRYDDRGVGKSTGEFGRALTGDFADDAEAAFRYLRGRPDIDSRRIGLLGHSEGGVDAPIVAARNPDVAFLVLLAAPGVPMSELMTAQRIAIATAAGTDPKTAEAAAAAAAQMTAAMAGAKDEEDARARGIAAMKAATPGVPDSAIEAQARIMASPWFRDLMAYDPAPNLQKIRVPVLAINGAKDRQVVASQNLPALKSALKDDPDVTIVELPGLNHLFQTAQTGGVGEYVDIPETMAPIALTTVSDWIVAHTRR